MSIIEAIKRANFAASGAQIEQLARSVVEGVGAAATYLACLVAACQSSLGKRGRVGIEAQIKAIEAAHGNFYPSVVKGVSDSSTDEAEAQRRATFARTACSTLRGYARGGGDIRKLDAATVTKTQLQRAFAPAEPTDKLARRFTRAHGSFVRACKAVAGANPEFAAEAIQSAVDELTEMLEGLPELVPLEADKRERTGPLPRVTGGQLRRQRQPVQRPAHH